MTYRAEPVAPVVLFVYNRLRHTTQTINALRENRLADETTLFIFSDASKKSEDNYKVSEIRKYIQQIEGFKKIEIVERERNYGLAKSIIDGVSDIIAKNGRVIVLEDDLVASPFFLQYMNDALDFYRNEDRVVSIHGYCYPLPCVLPETFFLRGADCWGWGTWERAWRLFEKDGEKLLKAIDKKALKKKFDVNGSYPFYRMLKYQVKGKNSSWAIRWHASAFLNDRLTLYPGVSLVHNIGNDNSGTHSVSSHEFDTEVGNEPVTIAKILVEENEYVLKELQSFFEIHECYGRLSLTRLFMTMAWYIAKKILPSRAHSSLKSLVRRTIFKEKKQKPIAGLPGYFGDFPTWGEAKTKATGQESHIAIELTKDVLLKGKRGDTEKLAEPFSETRRSWPLLAGLMWSTVINDGKLDVLDFGGGMGAAYYRNRKFFQVLKSVDWAVVEQNRSVERGKKENGEIDFCDSIYDCLRKRKPAVVIFTDSLQYCEHPYRILKEILDNDFKCVIFDATNFVHGGRDRIALRVTFSKEEGRSCPAWFFGIGRFKNTLARGYEMLAEFKAPGSEVGTSKSFKGYVGGMILKRKDEQSEKFDNPGQSGKTFDLKRAIKRCAKKTLPACLVDGLKKTVSAQYGFFGNYATWEEAKPQSGGYDSGSILEKVRDSLLKVKNGEAVYERDSVLFDEVHYSWPLLSTLLWAALHNECRLDVIDFGGSLGSSYFQNRKFLCDLDKVSWNIVEQENFVECGRKYFQDESLRFYRSIDECMQERNPFVIVLSSVLQYIERPYELLKTIMAKNFRFIIFDRTTFLYDEPDRITVQKVPPEIYPASYPAWFFNYEKFKSTVTRSYEVIAEFEALGGKIDLEDTRAYDRGMILKKK